MISCLAAVTRGDDLACFCKDEKVLHRIPVILFWHFNNVFLCDQTSTLDKNSSKSVVKNFSFKVKIVRRCGLYLIKMFHKVCMSWACQTKQIYFCCPLKKTTEQMKMTHRHMLIHGLNLILCDFLFWTAVNLKGQEGKESGLSRIGLFFCKVCLNTTLMWLRCFLFDTRYKAMWS